MEWGYLADWLNLLARWAHMVFGIAWIGASFYFVWLDNSLEKPPKTGNPRHLGELWSVHGGGFYHKVKFKSAPEKMPEHLHWFYWESYATWISGFFLMCVLYYASAETYLIDKSIADLSKWQAIGLGLGFLIAGWVVYDLMCRAFMRKPTLLSIGVVLYCVIAACALTHLFSGRGAFIHFGAMLATIMSANVLMVIIPGQRKSVAQMSRGEEPDPIHGERAKARSVHNTYFTLPVLFTMISNHYAMTYSSKHAWLVLLAIALAGAIIRLFFVLKHKAPPKWGILALGIAILVGVAVALKPPAIKPFSAQASGAAAAVSFAQVKAVVVEKCAGCHAAQPTYPGFAAAPKGYLFEKDDDIVRQAQVIHHQTVTLKAMPIGNLTNITEEQRLLIDVWYRSGARAH
jgi:uncharacterized membrane protein